MNHAKQKFFLYAPGVLACALLLTAGCSKRDERNPIFEKAKAQCVAANAGNPDAVRGCKEIEEIAAVNCVNDPTPEQDRKCKQLQSMVIAGGNSDWGRKHSGYPPEPRMPTAPPWNK